VVDWVFYLDIFGTFVFAVSGVLTAIDKKFDLVGSLVIGFVTAIGGGTIRDILIGNFPVGWLNNRYYIFTIFGAFIFSYLFKSKILKLKRSMLFFDTLGIGLFTVLGIQTTLSFGLSYEVALIMGVVSAVFGGVIRDVLTNEVPLIFRKEIYASACFIGGLVYLALHHFTTAQELSILVSIANVMCIRFLSLKNGWSLIYHN